MCVLERLGLSSEMSGLDDVRRAVVVTLFLIDRYGTSRLKAVDSMLYTVHLLPCLAMGTEQCIKWYKVNQYTRKCRR